MRLSVKDWDGNRAMSPLRGLPLNAYVTVWPPGGGMSVVGGAMFASEGVIVMENNLARGHAELTGGENESAKSRHPKN